ncbi:MAG: Ig-like domain-containing protein [Luteolibacter sp.]
MHGTSSQPGARPIVSYVWQVGGQQIATGANPTVPLSTGIRDIQLTVTDDVGLSGTDTVRVTVSNSEFRNGSFENSLTGQFTAGGHSVLGEGLAGWTPQGETDALTAFAGHPATDGQTVLVFNGGGKAAGNSISQTFPTVAGRTYLVDFNLGVIAYNTSNLQRLTAQIMGAVLQPLQTFDQTGIGSGASNGNVVWTGRGFTFVADSTVTSLILRDASPFTMAMDLVVDNVRVRAQTDRTLTLASQPAGGVNLVVSPTDLDGASGGATPMVRNFADGSVVTVTAPLVSGGQGFRRWLSNGVDVGNANPITVTLAASLYLTVVYEGGPPVILGHPVSIEKTPGDAASFSVSAAGTGALGYQWRFNQTAINGATGASHQIPSVTGLAAGTYDVVVTGSEGQTTSQPAVLSVAVPDFLNGSFEAGLEGWQVEGNTFLLGIYPGYEASEGSQLIVFNGGNTAPDGSISRTFNTVPGVTYRVSYDARIVAFHDDQQLLRLEVTGNTLLRAANHAFTGSSAGQIPWQTFSESFVADSLTTTVKFRDLSTQTISIDLLLDNVHVVAQSPVQFVQPQPPSADPQSLGTAEDTAVAVSLSGSGGSGPLTYVITAQPVHGTLSGTLPSLLYTPVHDFYGSDSFRFVVNDGSGDSAEATISITVSAVNDPPLANAQSLATNEDTPLGITLTGSDVDGGSLTYVVSGNPAHGALSGTAPNLTYTPNANIHGNDSLTFTVSDGIASPAQATVTITIIPVNDPPLANAQSIATNEDTPLGITLTGSDVDGGSLTYVVSGNPAHGALSGSAPNLTYMPNADFHGNDSFTFTVSDGVASPVQATVTIAVNPVNDPPIANAQPLAFEKNTPSAVVLAGSDVDGDSLTFLVTAIPAHGVLSGAAPSLAYTPHPGYFGPDSLTFTVSDGVADPVAATIAITVSAVGEPLPDLRAERLAGTCRVVLIPHAAGSYRVEWSDAFEDWQLVEEKIVTQTGEIEIIDTNATGDRRFYRASMRP